MDCHIVLRSSFDGRQGVYVVTSILSAFECGWCHGLRPHQPTKLKPRHPFQSVLFIIQAWFIKPTQSWFDLNAVYNQGPLGTVRVNPLGRGVNLTSIPRWFDVI